MAQARLGEYIILEISRSHFVEGGNKDRLDLLSVDLGSTARMYGQLWQQQTVRTML